MRKLSILMMIFLVLAAFPLAASDWWYTTDALISLGSYPAPPDSPVWNSSNSLELFGALGPGGYASIIQKAGTSFVDNPLFPLSIDLTAAGTVSPVTVDGKFDLIFTPAAFLVFNAGGFIGTGWPLPALNAQGAVYQDGGITNGLVWSINGSATFQFDLAVVVPGDWNHLQFQTVQKFSTRSFQDAPDPVGVTHADAVAASQYHWQWMNGDFEANVRTYTGTYTLAYDLSAISPVVKTIALIASTSYDLFAETWGWSLQNAYQFRFFDRISMDLGFKYNNRGISEIGIAASGNIIDRLSFYLGATIESLPERTRITLLGLSLTYKPVDWVSLTLGTTLGPVGSYPLAITLVGLEAKFRIF